MLTGFPESSDKRHVCYLTLQSHMEAGWAHVTAPGHCLWQLKKAAAVVAWPSRCGDISAGKQESPVSSAFRGGPGLGEFPKGREAWGGGDGDETHGKPAE